MASSIYPGQASFLEQVDPWSHRPKETATWTPAAEVSRARVGSSCRGFARGTLHFCTPEFLDLSDLILDRDPPSTQTPSGSVGLSH